MGKTAESGGSPLLAEESQMARCKDHTVIGKRRIRRERHHDLPFSDAQAKTKRNFEIFSAEEFIAAIPSTFPTRVS
jgi:hypothetical protein